ncbi:MAG: TlpA family protein disulfide reductase [Candidatus Tectomicrobia bacterium]|uniref:TlpA family protein disulfide reductase n=1 Tax=Tectimicrobiota bacterium TaxID=2528274 RepID=A0A932HW26_UNCTE|nr:TlpA family protein disulfide reductase [Candidatus Tectomicrobia bacterium]
MVRGKTRWFAWTGALLLSASLGFMAFQYLFAPAGESAPDLRLQNLAGEEIRLSQLRGKTVVVNFWATWCQPCVYEIPELARFSESQRDRNVVVLGVAMDKNVDKVRDFVQRFKVSYPIVIGDIATARLWQVRGLPMTFIISPAGKVDRVIPGGITQAALEAAIRPRAGGAS